jgi:hypothetical protein
VATGSVAGYQVLAYEDHPLVPDFNFQVRGNDTENVTYQPFPNADKAEIPLIIMDGQTEGQPVSQTRRVTIDYLVKVPIANSTDRYENTVTYIAVPKY